MRPTEHLPLTIAACVAFGALAGICCVHPAPPPPVADAAPEPSDRFTGRVFDCHLDTVAVERESAKPDVAACLQSSAAAPCILALGQYSDATVACLVRDLGASDNADVLAGDATKEPAANAARDFIRNHQLGYR